jgi:hypothetical protein
MPNEYHYKIKICSSYPEMVRFLVKKNKMKKDYRKVAKKFSKEIETDKEYNKDYAVSRELAKKYPDVTFDASVNKNDIRTISSS